MKKLNQHITIPKCILLVVLCLVLIFLVYYFPLQRIFAQLMLVDYMDRQGVNTDEVESVEYFKDYKQDGYYISVRFYGDEYRYLYRYYLISCGHCDGIKYHTMYCDVYDQDNENIERFIEGMKYKSLEWE